MTIMIEKIKDKNISEIAKIVAQKKIEKANLPLDKIEKGNANETEVNKIIQKAVNGVSKDMEYLMGQLTDVANKAKDFARQEVVTRGYKKVEDIQEPALKNLVVSINELDKIWEDMKS